MGWDIPLPFNAREVKHFKTLSLMEYTGDEILDRRRHQTWTMNMELIHCLFF